MNILIKAILKFCTTNQLIKIFQKILVLALMMLYIKILITALARADVLFKGKFSLRHEIQGQ